MNILQICRLLIESVFFIWFFSGNQTTTLSKLSIAYYSFTATTSTISSFSNTTATTFSFSTTSTTTAAISALSSPNQVAVVMQKKQLDNVQRRNDHEISDSIKISTKLFSVLCILYISFVLFKWRNTQRRYSFKILSISLSSLVVIVLYVSAFV